MSLERGLEKLRDKPSSTFDRQLQDWGVSMPDMSIGDFLRDTCGVKEVNDYWNGQKIDKFCLNVAHERNNGHEEIAPGVKKPPINPERKKELYEALKNYTDQRIKKFREKEKAGAKGEDLIKEKKEILPFVRAREALKEKRVIDYRKAAIEQKIRDAKLVRRLTVKAG